MTDIPPIDPADLPEGFAAIMAGLVGDVGPDTVQAIAAQMPRFVSKAASCDPVLLAASFAALLTRPELHGNALRLEALVHLTLAVGNGGRQPNGKLIASGFSEIGKTSVGRAEDPSEDVLVGAVRTRRGNFRVLDGTWEGSTFYLQNFLDVMATMPIDQEYARVHRSVFALLAISEAVCERCGLVRHMLGASVGQNTLTSAQQSDLSRRRPQLRFTPSDLSELGVDVTDLAPFLLHHRSRRQLLEEMFGNSLIDRQPLVQVGDDLVLILPTAISTAVRYFILDQMAGMDRLGTFLRNQAAVYEQWLAEMPLLGGRIGTPTKFIPGPFGANAEVMIEIDVGRFLHLILITDCLRDFARTGLAGIDPSSLNLSGVISGKIREAHQFASQNDRFVNGLTLVVSCCIGRGAGLALDESTPPGWRVDFASAPDLETLSWTKDFQPTSLWKILEAQDALAASGLNLLNVNGLVNLVAWARSLDGHLIPHAQMPEDFVQESVMATVMINQNSLRDLRHEVATDHDTRVECTPDGRWLRVRRDSLSVFRDDQAAPTYASEDTNEDGRPMSVFRAPRRAWWANTTVDESATGHQAYERWRMVGVWLSRAAPILDNLPGLPPGPVIWRANFAGELDEFDGRTLDYAAARASINVRIDANTNSVTTSASPNFNQALHHPENIAERALVDALIEGFEQLSGAIFDADRHGRLLDQIVPNVRARNSHAFYAQTFRDEIGQDGRKSVVYLEPEDEAPLRLGLGWRTRDRDSGNRIEGKRECTAYLNSLVKSVTKDLVADLSSFNRAAMMRLALNNHEMAAQDRDNWRRTASAVLALHDDREDALQQFAEHEFKLNAVFQGARFIAEIANSASPIEGGRKPGVVDLTRLTAKAGLIFQLGGWSDAIHWNVMQPLVKITALGDVHANLGFVDEIIAPHARASSDVRVDDAADRYDLHFERPTGEASTAGRLDPNFLEAWEEQFGAPFDDLRVLLDFIDNLGREADALIIQVPRSAFDQVVVGDLAVEAKFTQNLLAALSSLPTIGWDLLPEGFEARDRHLWRFRRRLSVLRRPLLQLDHSKDPTYVIAPGLVREAISHQLVSYFQGDFPAEQLSPKMLAWKVANDGKRGTVFSEEVAEALKVAGWATDIEVAVTKLLKQGFDRDYGDVDVLAWKPGTNRVLIIECKDVQYRKTYGEVAEQLADFRGERRPNGRPDYLLRHLDRIDIISSHLDQVKQYTGSTVEVVIESYLVFRNPVPMEFALRQLSKRVQVRNFSQVSSI